MGEERPPASQSLFTAVWINLHLHFKPFLKEGGEKEIVIPFEIFDMDALPGQPLETPKDGKVVGKGERSLGNGRALGGRTGFKSEKKLKEISQDHEISCFIHLRIEKSEERLHPFRSLPCKMGIGDENPVLFGTNQWLTFTFPHRYS
jgi:hypothetical protein